MQYEIPGKTAMKKKSQAHAIVFGFDRATDEQSLQLFVQRFADKQVQEILVSRLQDNDIIATVDFLTAMMQKYLSEEEYHTFFLAE